MNGSLSSDILGAQFGPTSLLVMFQAGNERVIQTRAKDVVLELSYVQFSNTSRQQFPAVTHAIEAGESMGRVFRDTGVTFTRHTRFVTKIAPLAFLSELFASDEPVWAIKVDITAGSGDSEFASIIEFYNPLVAWPEQPRQLTTLQQQELAECQATLKAKLFS